MIVYPVLLQPEPHWMLAGRQFRFLDPESDLHAALRRIRSRVEDHYRCSGAALGGSACRFRVNLLPEALALPDALVAASHRVEREARAHLDQGSRWAVTTHSALTLVFMLDDSIAVEVARIPMDERERQNPLHWRRLFACRADALRGLAADADEQRAVYSTEIAVPALAVPEQQASGSSGSSGADAPKAEPVGWVAWGASFIW